MREALNGFVIRGIASNIPFQSALLAHPQFVAGEFNTGFITEHFPAGFTANAVQHDDPDFLLALAAAVHRRFRGRAAGISGQLAGHELQIGQDYVVVVKGAAGLHRHVPVRIQRQDSPSGQIVVTVDGSTPYAIDHDWGFGGIRASGSCNGQPFTAQIERLGLWLRLAHNGLALDVLVMSPRAAELLKLMPFKPPADMSKFLLSPMPGLLADIAVAAGQKVEAGQRLATIEAMKMENIITAAQAGTIAQLLAAPGESLAVDQPILSFA